MKNPIYIFSGGKNTKLLYYIKHYCQLYLPNCFYRNRLQYMLRLAQNRTDSAYIQERVNYYNKLKNNGLPPLLQTTSISQFKVKKPKVYYFDTYACIRYFPEKLRYILLPGDITTVPEYPSFVKSRPIHGENSNSVLLKLNEIRHFIFVNDKTKFADKKDMIIFRGKVKALENRQRFMQMYTGHPMCDLGDTGKHTDIPVEWRADKMTIKEHLQYKFILALEGNDVASNLKWVMSSNSVAVMPRPTYETWFMEGRLIPNYHYIEIKPDFTDLEERLKYYIAHPDEAKAIARHANEYVAQFKDKKREKLISLLVAEKYFVMIGQNFAHLTK